MIDALASSIHFVDHLAPVWQALDGGERGPFWVTSREAEARAVHHGLSPVWCDLFPRGTGLVLVASWGDVAALRGRPFVMVEHGAGETYSGEPAADSRPTDCRCAMRLMLCPSELVAARNRIHHPHAKVVAVGSPKVEQMAAHRRTVRRDIRAENMPRNIPRPVVGLAWHWNSDLHPGARWAFPHWRKAIAELATVDPGFDLLGHGHPRAMPSLLHFYRRAGIPWTTDPDEIIGRADVVAFDVTSFGFEAAACGIPVVLLDAPAYTGCTAGLRHGRAAGVGLHAATGDATELAVVIGRTLHEDPCAAVRAAIATAVYGRLDGSTRRAVAALRSI